MKVGREETWKEAEKAFGEKECGRRQTYAPFAMAGKWVCWRQR